MGKSKNASTGDVNLDHVWADTDAQLEEQKRAVAAIKDVKLQMCPKFPAKDLKPGEVSKAKRGNKRNPHFPNSHMTAEEEEAAIHDLAVAIVAEFSK